MDFSITCNNRFNKENKKRSENYAPLQTSLNKNRMSEMQNPSQTLHKKVSLQHIWKRSLETQQFKLEMDPTTIVAAKNFIGGHNGRRSRETTFCLPLWSFWEERLRSAK